MAILSSLLIFLVLLGIISVIIVTISKKGVSGLKIMLLGISIILFGGILIVDPSTTLGGIEYLIALLGLILSVVGFGKRD